MPNYFTLCNFHNDIHTIYPRFIHACWLALDDETNREEGWKNHVN